MLALVNDIGAYPEFLHWCRGARIEHSNGPIVEAALEIGFSGIAKTIKTRNTTELDPQRNLAGIRIDMLEGPLKSLRGSWRFSNQASGNCDVELRLEYEVHRSPFGRLLKSLFDEIANSQLNAFVRRAKVVYGDNRKQL